MTALGAAGLVAGVATWGGEMLEVHHLWLPALAAAVILGECFPVRLARADGEVTVSTGFSLALLWLAGPAAVLLIQIAAVMVAEIRSRRRTDRMLFNASQLTLAWLATAVVMDAVGDRGATISGGAAAVAADVAAFVAAGAAFSAVNLTLTATAASLASGVAFRSVVAGYAGIELGTMLMLTGFAPVIVATMQTAPLLLPLLAFPLAAMRMSGMALTRTEHMALHDGLTGLANRVQLRRLLGEQAAAGPATVLVFDLDRFKDVNDSLGHVVGDHLLRRIAGELRTGMPADVHAARLAGDEFVLVSPGDGPALGDALAERVRALLRSVPDVDGMRLEVEASIGIARAPEHGGDPDILLKRAEIAMYEAKQRRNAVAVYRDGTDEEAAERLRLVGDLRQAIAASAIAVHYQPKVDMRSGRVCGVEALARWTHPRRGPVSPGVFIPLAEAGGLIGELGSVVLDLAVAQLARWRAEGLELHMAVNVSVRRLLDDGVVEEVAGLLARYGVPPSALELEITESVFLDDPGRAQAVLGELSALGVSLAVDDYGTGYSSLAYLRDLPVSTLKLDRSFVGGVTSSASDEAIVLSTMLLARSLELQVVAEGIEDAETMLAVRRLGCDQAQGFHISRPQPAEALTPWLHERAGTAPLVAA